MIYSPFSIFNKLKEIDLNEAIKYLGLVKTNKKVVLEKLKEILISDSDHHVRGIAAKVLIENFFLESRLIIK